MRALISRYRAQAERVKYMGHLVPADHQDGAEDYQVLWFFIAWFIGMAPFFYLFRNLTPEDNWVFVIPTWSVTAAAWGICHLLYLRRMDQLIKKFVPGSFKIPVAPANF